MSGKQRLQVLPSVLTAFGLMCGLFVIFKVNMTEVGEMQIGTLKSTAALLLLAGLFDVLDGILARAMKAVTAFGGVFDSIADAVSFGVAPVVIVLKSLSIETGTPASFLITTAALVFSVSGVLRLVRFSVNAHPSKQEEISLIGEKKSFVGLPIPAAAVSIVSLNLFLISPELQVWVSLGITTRVIFLSAALIVLGYFMISRWRFPSIKKLQMRVSSFRSVFLIVVIAAFLFYGLLHHFVLVFFCISWLYLVIAWAVALVRLLTGREVQSKDDLFE